MHLVRGNNNVEATQEDMATTKNGLSERLATAAVRASYERENSEHRPLDLLSEQNGKE